MPSKMRPFGEVISLEAARAILDTTGTPIARTEMILLSEANGRVLAADVIAQDDVPPFARAGMDGYAVRAFDTRGSSRANPRTLVRTGTLYTGQVSPIPVHDGHCIEISTGAPMPDGADSVVMVEETDAGDGDVVRIFAEVQPQQNVGRRGADIQIGQIVVAAGETLNSSRIGALAAVGTVRVEVYDRPQRGRSCRPATKSLCLVSISGRDKSTTSIASPSLPSCPKMAAYRSPILQLQTRSTRSSRSSTIC